MILESIEGIIRAMQPGIVTLLTDFGEGSPYVACMKGILWSMNPTLRVVDITHRIAPQDVRQAAFVLRQVAPFFPDGAIHIAVVDPGVGTDRALLYAEMGRQRFLAPDNGLLSWIEGQPPTQLRSVVESRFWRQPVSPTFHGRDILAPVAAHLSLGVPPEELGPARAQMVRIPWPRPQRSTHRLEGEVLVVDSFGNLITNISREDLAGLPANDVHVEAEGHETTGIHRTYGDVPTGTLRALVGSSDLLELAVTCDNAATMLCLGPGAQVRLSW